MFTLWGIWNYNQKRVSIYFLFYLTFGLFIGGRFFASLFDPEVEPFATTFFYTYNVPYSRKVSILYYVLCFMFFSTIGFVVSKQKKIKPFNRIRYTEIEKRRIGNLLKRFYPFFLIMVVLAAYRGISEGLSGGYLAQFVGRANESYSGSSLTGIIATLSSISLGLSFAISNRKVEKYYFITFLIISLGQLFVGNRSSFGSLLLFSLYLYSLNHKINIKKLILSLLIGSAILLFFFSFSIRQMSKDVIQVTPYEAFIAFIEEQGGSLMIFDVSRLIPSYPILPYFQSFIPGVSFLYRQLVDPTLPFWEISFSNYMCYELNPNLFLEGAGLGWSILSDLYLFSGRIFLLFIVLSFMWGYLIGIIEQKALKSDFFRGVIVAILPSILLLPRGGVFTFFPLLVYLFVVGVAMKIVVCETRSSKKKIYV